MGSPSGARKAKGGSHGFHRLGRNARPSRKRGVEPSAILPCFGEGSGTRYDRGWLGKPLRIFWGRVRPQRARVKLSLPTTLTKPRALINENRERVFQQSGGRDGLGRGFLPPETTASEFRPLLARCLEDSVCARLQSRRSEPPSSPSKPTRWQTKPAESSDSAARARKTDNNRTNDHTSQKTYDRTPLLIRPDPCPPTSTFFFEMWVEVQKEIIRFYAPNLASTSIKHSIRSEGGGEPTGTSDDPGA